MVQNFEAVNLMAIHAKRVTIMPQDLRNYIQVVRVREPEFLVELPYDQEK